MTKRILVGAVFVAGCAVGGASSQLVVPKASAQQAAQLTKWEVHCAVAFDSSSHADQASNATAVGNKLGSQAWEPIGGDEGIWCFKRPKL